MSEAGTQSTPLCDVHCHFFSDRFFQILGTQKGSGAQAVLDELGWEAPGSPEVLTERWLGELDRFGVGRAALIASLPGDEDSVAAALARAPERLVGFFMLDPTQEDAPQKVQRAMSELKLRTVCLFPAMHRYALHEPRVEAVVQAASRLEGTAVFVHCGVLTVGVRKKLKLPSRFDMRFSNPLDLHSLALAYPQVPFILPHFGGGFFREALMLADLCPNVYLDTSSSNSWIKYHPGLTLEAVFRQALAVAGARRLLFGTDSSFFPRGWQKGVFQEQTEIMKGLRVSEEDRGSILGGNFSRLFPAAPAA